MSSRFLETRTIAICSSFQERRWVRLTEQQSCTTDLGDLEVRRRTKRETSEGKQREKKTDVGMMVKSRAFYYY